MESQIVNHLLGHLHWLTVLAEQGSFTAAAARLGVSKASVSQRIAELERAAGVPLVQRTTRSMRLTEAGRRLVDHTRASFDTIAQSFASVRDLAEVPRGLVRVTVPVALARQQLVPRLPEFLRQYPDVRVELDMSDRLVPLAMEGYDLAVRHTATPPDTHVAWRLCGTRAVLVADRAYLRRRGHPQHPDDLRDHSCLHYPRGRETPAWHFLERVPARGRKPRQAQRITVPVQGPLAANNSEALRDAALEGLGIALVPDFTAQAALQAGKLVEVLPQWQATGAFGEHIYAIRPYTPTVPRAVAAFVDWLRQAFPEGFDT